MARWEPDRATSQQLRLDRSRPDPNQSAGVPAIRLETEPVADALRSNTLGPRSRTCRSEFMRRLSSLPAASGATRIVSHPGRSLRGHRHRRREHRTEPGRAGTAASTHGPVFGRPDQDWAEATLGSACALHRLIAVGLPRRRKRASGSSRRKNVKTGLPADAPARIVNPENYESRMTRGILRRGDVLFITEAPLANVAQPDTDERVVFAQRIIIMQPDPRSLDSNFLKYLLHLGPVQRLIHATGATGADCARYQGAACSRLIPISFPRSLRDQARIVAVWTRSRWTSAASRSSTSISSPHSLS